MTDSPSLFPQKKEVTQEDKQNAFLNTPGKSVSPVVPSQNEDQLNADISKLEAESQALLLEEQELRRQINEESRLKERRRLNRKKLVEKERQVREARLSKSHNKLFSFYPEYTIRSVSWKRTQHEKLDNIVYVKPPSGLWAHVNSNDHADRAEYMSWMGKSISMPDIRGKAGKFKKFELWIPKYFPDPKGAVDEKGNVIQIPTKVSVRQIGNYGKEFWFAEDIEYMEEHEPDRYEWIMQRASDKNDFTGKQVKFRPRKVVLV